MRRYRTDPASSPGTNARIPRPGSSRKAVGLIVALVAVMLGAGTVAGVLYQPGGGAPPTPQQLATAAPTPSGLNNKPLAATNAQLMGLQRLTPSRAPDFTLTGQHGHVFSLDQLDRTHAVVLSFMDDRCVDICPLVAQELTDAYRNLGKRAAGVEFVSVNVNAAHNATRWLRAFVASHSPELSSVPTFHYLTGQPAALSKVWSDYKITVKVDPTTGAVYHSEGMYFIAPGGREIYEATPFANLRQNGTGWLPHATIVQWGQGIAQYARAALAAGGQH